MRNSSGAGPVEGFSSQCAVVTNSMVEGGSEAYDLRVHSCLSTYLEDLVEVADFRGQERIGDVLCDLSFFQATSDEWPAKRTIEGLEDVSRLTVEFAHNYSVGGEKICRGTSFP